jgi:hypothetical protein
VLRAEVGGRPVGREARDRVELVQREPADRCPIVVADQRGSRIEADHALDALARPRAVADDITEVPDLADLTGGSQDCLQRDQVRVNIGEDQNSRHYPTVVRLGARLSRESPIV